MSQAALLVNTSSVEGFPNAYLEAWSQGVAVVAFEDVDGLIRSENIGVVCASFDALVEAVGRLAAAPDERVRLGQRARELVKRRFSPAAIVGDYVTFFAELLESQGVPRTGVHR